MKNLARALLPTIAIVFSLSSFAPTMAAEDDSLMRAMHDEMERTLKDLRTNEHPAPYFMSYRVKEVDQATSSSCLGSTPITSHTRERLLFPEIRLGSYDTDSSYPLSTRPNYYAKVPLDDDYDAMRRWIWLNTDHVYKYAVRSLEWKKAYLTSNSVPNRLPDMSAEKPTLSMAPLLHVGSENEKWAKTIQELSKVFADYPTLQKSKVSFISRGINSWYINSEGAKVRDSRSQYVVRFWASAQAGDGMPLSDCDVAVSIDEANLPPIDELKKMAQELAKRVSDLQLAAKGEDYNGPVLFEGQAAAELFSQVMAPNFGFAEEYLGSEGWRNPLKNALGRKILPSYISVVDDPDAKDEHGIRLPGDYKFDDEGVAATKVNLVENGILKGFCQSRIPTRHNNRSNGHSLGGHGVPSVLEVISTKSNTPDEIKQKLTDLAKDAGLDYVLVVTRLKDDFVLIEYPTSAKSKYRPYATPSYSVRPSDPVWAYKLYLTDGHREPVRGLEFRHLSLRAFRDIQAIASVAHPYFVEPNDCVTRALVIPNFVIGEVELTPVTPEHSSPPIVPNPLAKLAVSQPEGAAKPAPANDKPEPIGDKQEPVSSKAELKP